jgi:DNA recombination protein RmuC
MDILTAVVVAVALAAAVAAAYLIGAMRARVRHEAAAAAILSELQTEQKLRTVAETRLEESQKKAEELSLFFERSRRELTGTYAELSQKALKDAVDSLATVVTPHLEKADQKISSNLLQNLQPVREMLDRYQEELRKSEQQRQFQTGAIQQQIESLAAATEATRKQAEKVATALGGPKSSGNWGEMALRRCVELAGMSEHCDFEVQWSGRNEDSSGVRPDMIVRLPNERVIFVDAKVPIDAYQQAMAETDEKRRGELMLLHARTLKRHVEELSRRKYPTAVRDSLDFTILFVGGDQFLSGALTTDPMLYESAVQRSVFLASPTLLVPLLRVVALVWKAEKAEESAQNALEIGRDLYDRFVTVFDHFEGVGKALNSAVGRYNDAVRSVDSRLVPKANQLREHISSRKEMPEVSQIDTMTRESSKIAGTPMRLPIRELQQPDEEAVPEQQLLLDDPQLIR